MRLKKNKEDDAKGIHYINRNFAGNGGVPLIDLLAGDIRIPQ